MIKVSKEFKPSQVHLGVPPLCDTMGKAEIEHAASMLVAACSRLGDKWQAVEQREMGRAVQAMLDAGGEPWVSLRSNLFFRPDFHALMESDFAEYNEVTDSFSLTAKGIDSLRRWVVAK